MRITKKYKNLTEWVFQNYELLLHYAIKQNLTADESEDLIQNMLLEILTHKIEVEKPRSYAFTWIRHRSINYILRVKKKQPKSLESLLEDGFEC